MVLEYLRCCRTPVGTPLRDLLRTGEVTGATALAPALADLAGGDPVPVRARRDGDGWRLSGRIPWASNLFDDAVAVTPARTEDDGRIVVVLRLSAATALPTGPLLALNGTGTVHMDDAAVPAGAELSSDLAFFLQLCLPAMLLTQSAMAVGLADATLAFIGEVLNGVDGALRSDRAELAARAADVAGRLNALAANPRTGDRPGFARLRLDAMQLAADAVRLEGAVRLGGGFRADSPTSRRVREAAFLPVQAPTVGQLQAQAN
jgi:alkylation response protein AidB-like acyl-CoA dehydrogenase